MNRASIPLPLRWSLPMLSLILGGMLLMNGLALGIPWLPVFSGGFPGGSGLPSIW